MWTLLKAGVYVTVYLGSVFRAVLTVTLSGLIWALDVALFYSPLGHRVFGEPLDPQVGVGGRLWGTDH